MNTAFKSTLIFVAGFASGVAATYAVATLYLGLEWVDDDKTATNGSDIHGDINSDDVDDQNDANNSSDADGSVVINNDRYDSIENNTEFVDYTKFSEAVSKEGDEIPPQVDIFDDENKNAKPVIIKSNEFGTDLEYTEAELRYYPDVDLLTDDWDLAVEDIESTCGTEVLDYVRANPESTFYARNDRLKMYYEIATMPYDYPGVPVED